MEMPVKKWEIPAAIILAFFVLVMVLAVLLFPNKNTDSSSSQVVSVMGGVLHSAALDTMNTKTIRNQAEEEKYMERFRRPSQQALLNNSYSFADFEKEKETYPLITQKFGTAEDVSKAYFGILRDAANMDGYGGGCGTIGNAKQPYPYAYELLSQETQKKVTLQAFTESFHGIGYITLLKLLPAYTLEGTSIRTKYFMVEAEVITGPSEKDTRAYYRGGSYFAYYYGLLTAHYTQEYGWKIQSIDYLPEDFLCHPMHGWAYNSAMLVPIVYKDWYDLIEKVDSTTQNGGLVSVFASGKGQKYRFDFARLTNGTDILLHEYKWINGAWEEVNLLKDSDQGLKLSVLNPNLKAKSK